MTPRSPSRRATSGARAEVKKATLSNASRAGNYHFKKFNVQNMELQVQTWSYRCMWKGFRR